MSYLALVDRLLADGLLEDLPRPAAQPAQASASPSPPLGLCPDCGARLPAGVAIALCGACRRQRNPDAGELPPAAPPYPLAVVVDELPEPAGPFAPNPWTTVADPARCIAADLASLRAAVEAYAWCWHDPAELAAATELGERIAELLALLERCGVRARVVAAS